MASGLTLRGISKSFGMIAANDDVDLDVEQGTIHGIVGENGAGKSTLMNILYGLHRADKGEIYIEGAPAPIKIPSDAIRHGIGMVHQHFMLVQRFSVLENVMLGAEGGHFLAEGRRKAIRELGELSERYGLSVDPEALISDLNVGARQRVEIIKALKGGAKILILDEPTGVLTPQESEQLFEILKSLKESGVTILLITHKLDEIMAITDRVSIMRQGKMVGHRITRETNPQELAELMVGRPVLLDVGRGQSKPAEIVLSLSRVNAFEESGHQILRDISFDLRAGEILGVAGVSGNGQSELMEILTGMRPNFEGRITLLEQSITKDRPLDPRALRGVGLGHIPEDRHQYGLVLDFEAQENMILGYHKGAVAGSSWLLDHQEIGAHCLEQMTTFDIRPKRPDLAAKHFSGGNQQKIVIAREIFPGPRILVVGQPTRGVDVGAIEFIHRRLIALRDEGCAILLISVELDEVMGLSDRILVMNNGMIMGERAEHEFDVNEIGLMMAGHRGKDVA